MTPDQRRLLDALAGQAALAIERIQLAADVDKAHIAAETEKLRSALLTSISHDLKTPLASILGSATGLRSYRKQLDDAAQEELVRTIQEESERLNRFINNLLDMTRLESGAIAPNRELVDLSDVVGSALTRAAKILSGHNVNLSVPCATADAEARSRVVGTGAVQPARQRREIRARRQRNSASGPGARTISSGLPCLDEGAGIPAGRSRTDL